ncbi:hypothetical protein MRX96_042970, partial [Rhipicephalus microplus]
SPVGRDFRLRFETTPPPLRRLRSRLLAAGGRRPVLLYRVVEWTLYRGAGHAHLVVAVRRRLSLTLRCISCPHWNHVRLDPLRLGR